ncbi:MAG: tetratricopeptide repeat protein [Chitinophagaceae bacterium]
MNRTYYLISVLLFALLSQGQVNTDSLRKIISLENNSQKKAASLMKLCEQFRFSNPDSLLQVSKELLALGKKENNKGWKANAEFFIAVYYNGQGNADTAFLIAKKNIDIIRKEDNQQVLLAKFYSLAGNSLMRLNRQKDALQMFYTSLENAETTNDKDGLFKAYNNIGWAHMELEQFEKAIKNFALCIDVMQQLNVADKYATPYNNIASCYGSIGDVDSAYKYAQKGISIAEKITDYSAEANGYSIMGTFLSKEKSYEKALGNFEKAVSIREKMADPFFIISDLAEISDLQSKTGKTKEGILNGQKALEMAITSKIDAKLPMIYTALAHNYEKAGNYKEAAESYKKLYKLKDSLYSKANPKALAEIQTKYETEKQERKIEQQQARIVRQNYLFIGIAGMALLIGLLVQSQYKKNKLRQQAAMKTALMKEHEMAVKAVMEAEENERQRIAKDLHDGVGQMMSAAKMNLSAFESEMLFTNNEQKEAFGKIINLVDESCKEVRTVSHLMMPNALQKNNLGVAIGDFADKLSNKNLQVHVSAQGLDKRMDANIETVLYRVIQECVNNAVKHAGASTLDISLIRDNDGISGTIEDNGKGFDTNDKEQYKGIGLKNIISRIEYLKGTVDFDSAPGRGTVVALHVPNPNPLSP